MDFDFGKYTEYMVLGYAAMATILGLMIAWIYLRFRTVVAQQEQISQLEAEIAEERDAHKATTPDPAPDPVADVAVTEEA